MSSASSIAIMGAVFELRTDCRSFDVTEGVIFAVPPSSFFLLI